VIAGTEGVYVKALAHAEFNGRVHRVIRPWTGAAG
jgi:hypothetical protein